MTVGLAGSPSSAAVREEGIVEKSYSSLDLKARRAALSLWAEDAAAMFELNLTRYRSYETGGRDLLGDNAGLVDEMAAMESLVADEVARIVAGEPTDEEVVALYALADQQTFVERYPDARNPRGRRHAYPVMLHYVAVGRAAGELRRRGHDVEVYRGDRSFDLSAARAAAGLGKIEAAQLMGLNMKSYNRTERGTEPPPIPTLKELHAVDDFIVAAAEGFELGRTSGADTVITVTEDQDEFEKLYPEARFGRSGTPYPVRMLWVAAGRRAGALAAVGRPVRIAAAVE